MSEIVEKSVIGAILIDPKCVSEIYEQIRLEMFGSSFCRSVYAEILKAYDAGKQITLISIAQKLQGESFSQERIMQELKGILPDIQAYKIKSYADALVAEYKTRRLKEMLSKIIPAAGIVDEQFSLDVVDTDRFLDMSASAQALYFHLGMRADDDGFVSSPRKIAKASNCGLDDLTLLAAKGFIIPFESGVVVVTHWKENNYIRADRYKPTRYTKEAEMLEKIGDVYQLSTTGIPTDNQMVDTWDTQDRLGKDIYNTCAPQDGERVQFDQNDDVQYTDPEKKQSQIDERKENFEKIYAIYPKKRGKQRAFGLYCQWLKGRVIQGERIKLTNKEMYVAVRNYVRQQEQEQPDQKYWKNFDTLMGATLLDYVDKGEINE